MSSLSLASAAVRLRRSEEEAEEEAEEECLDAWACSFQFKSQVGIAVPAYTVTNESTRCPRASRILVICMYPLQAGVPQQYRLNDTIEGPTAWRGFNKFEYE